MLAGLSALMRSAAHSEGTLHTLWLCLDILVHRPLCSDPLDPCSPARQLLRAPADDALLEREPAWDAEPGAVRLNAGGRRAMLLHMGHLLCGEFKPIGEVRRPQAGLGLW